MPGAFADRRRTPRSPLASLHRGRDRRRPGTVDQVRPEDRVAPDRGQHDGERRSDARHALHLDTAGVRLGDPAADRQAEAGPAALAGAAAVDAVEAVEDPGQVLGRYADAGIPNADER